MEFPNWAPPSLVEHYLTGERNLKEYEQQRFSWGDHQQESVKEFHPDAMLSECAETYYSYCDSCGHEDSSKHLTRRGKQFIEKRFLTDTRARSIWETVLPKMESSAKTKKWATPEVLMYFILQAAEASLNATVESAARKKEELENIASLAAKLRHAISANRYATSHVRHLLPEAATHEPYICMGPSDAFRIHCDAGRIIRDRYSERMNQWIERSTQWAGYEDAGLIGPEVGFEDDDVEDGGPRDWAWLMVKYEQLSLQELLNLLEEKLLVEATVEPVVCSENANPRIVYFVRHMHPLLLDWFGEPLWSVLATIVELIFGKVLSRQTVRDMAVGRSRRSVKGKIEP